MGNNLSVQVLDSDGDPVEGARVAIRVHGILSGGFLETEYTDSDGQAEFTTFEDYDDSREITIYVNSDFEGEYLIGGGRYTIQLDE
jgi:uncharacterized GH25 family protein